MLIQNYLRTAARNLTKRRLFTGINLFGLSLGLSVVIIIALYVQRELSFDNFHTQDDQIYRVLRKADLNGSEYLIAITSGPFAAALLNDFPQSIKAATRVARDEGLVTYQNRTFLERKFSLADKNFFQFFSYPLSQGDPATVLATPNSIVLTTEMARKYFGESDPIGKTLRVDNQFDFIVTGVLADRQLRSHLDFDFLASIEVLNEVPWFQDWWSNNLFTYVRIETEQEARAVEAQLPAFMDKYLGEDFKRTGKRIDPALQPLAQIYLHKDIRYDWALHGDKHAVYIFSAIAAFIIIIAAANCMNLSTAQAAQRAQEIGVRKTLGAYRSDLVAQFFSESFLLVLLSILLAVAVVELLLPYFNATFDLDLALHLGSPMVLLAIAGLLLLVSVLASSYPAMLLSSFQPSATLKRQAGDKIAGVSIRQALVVFQFCVSVFLIVGTVFLQKQLGFLRTKDLGFQQEHVVLVQMNGREVRQRHEDLLARIRREPGIVSASAMSGQPGGFHDAMAFEVEGHDDNWRMRTAFTDHDYIETLGLKIVAGRNFSREHGTDAQQALLLNETAVRTLGWSNEEAIGKEMHNIMVDSTSRRVVGVVGDFHFSSLKTPIEPLMIAMRPARNVLAIRVKAAEMQNALATIERHWQELAAGYPFEYTFLDETFFALYQHEQRESKLLGIFAVVSIAIACLGLFGLAAIAAERRTKEIGVRKVLGASVSNLVALLSKEFLVLVAVANLIAWPLAWYAVRQWLENFVYRIEIEWWVFAVTGGFALIIALVTVSAQAIKAALTNPVEALRYE